MASLPIQVSICSPVHNEQDNLSTLVRRVHRAMASSNLGRWEQILVDDGSSDRSAVVIAELQQQYPNLRLCQHPINCGERAAWSTAFSAARGEVVVMLAADLQSPPEELPRLLAVVLEEGYDVGTGARTRRKDDLYYWAATRALNAGMCLAFGLQVKDVSSSFFAVRRRFVTHLPLVENDHRYVLAIFRRHGARIKEIGVDHAARKAGASHYSHWKVPKAVPEVVRFALRYFRGFYDLLGVNRCNMH